MYNLKLLINMYYYYYYIYSRCIVITVLHSNFINTVQLSLIRYTRG